MQVPYVTCWCARTAGSCVNKSPHLTRGNYVEQSRPLTIHVHTSCLLWLTSGGVLSMNSATAPVKTNRRNDAKDLRHHDDCCPEPRCVWRCLWAGPCNR